MNKILLIIVLILTVSAGFFTTAQTTGILRGTVSDNIRGEALPFANILIIEINTGASSDINGNFTITGVPPGTYTVQISYVGYKKDSVQVTIVPDKVTQVSFDLTPVSIQLETVEMVGERTSRPNETNLGLQKMTIRELELLPKGVETDIFRSLQFIPGVQSTGDVSARYFVRGGGSDQNLVLLNGVSVYNPFHVMGLFSIIDPEMVNALEFYKGGFTSEFGGRLSSVMDIVTKDGNKNKYGGNVSLSFLTAKAALEGPIPGGSFIFTGRKSLFNTTLKKFVNMRDAPFDFYDMSGKVNFSSSTTESLTKILFHGFTSADNLKNPDPEKADFNWSNNLFGAYWFQAWKDVPIYSEANLSVSNFSGDINPKAGTSKERFNEITDVTMRTDFTNIFESRDELKVGYNLKSVNTAFRFENLQGIKSAVDDKGFHLSVYGKYRFLRYEALGIDIGSRINAISMSTAESAILEPRVNLSYVVYPGITLKGAWGIYTQELITLTNETEIISLFEPWLVTPDYIRVPEAVHYVAGLDVATFGALTFGTEIYYKDLRHTAEVNELKADETDPDFIQGKGESYGMEFIIRFNNQFAAFTGSYALSWTYRDINGWISHPKYDSRHNVNLNLNFDFGSGWHSGLSWFFNSGLPFTQIMGFYDKLYFETLFNTGLYGHYIPYSVLADKNLGRLPTYHRLDLNITKKFKIYVTDVELSFSIMNVYDRKNIFYFERDTGERVNMIPFLPTATIKIEI